jgi:hypothetical protein
LLHFAVVQPVLVDKFRRDPLRIEPVIVVYKLFVFGFESFDCFSGRFKLRL